MAYQELLAEHTTIKEENASLKEQLAQLYKLISGFRSERFVAEIAREQLSLFEGTAATSGRHTPIETITYTREKQKHPGRHALPEHLPVREVVIEPEEDTTGLSIEQFYRGFQEYECIVTGIDGKACKEKCSIGQMKSRQAIRAKFNPGIGKRSVHSSSSDAAQTQVVRF